MAQRKLSKSLDAHARIEDDPAATVTIQETLTDYLLDCEAEAFAPATIDQYRRDLGAFVAWLEANGQPTDMYHLQAARGAAILKLYRQHVTDHGGRLQRDGSRGPAAQGNIATKHRHLKAFGHWCVKRSRDLDGRPNNPPFVRQSFADKDLGKAPKDTTAANVGVPYTPEELQRLLVEFGSERSSDLRVRRNRALLLAIRYSGLRRAEAAKVLMEHYDPANGTIHLPDGVAKKTKRTSDKRTTLICNAKAQSEVNGYVKLMRAKGKGTGHLFPSFKGGKALTPWSVSDLIGRAIDRVQAKCPNAKAHPRREDGTPTGEGCDLPGGQCIRFSGVHRLRATWCSEQRMEGTQDGAIMIAAGWESLTMLDKYSRHVKNEAALGQLKRVNGLH